MEETLNSCLIVFELMGLQYFSLKSLTQDNLKTRPSILRTMFMLVLFAFLTTVVILYVTSEQVISTKNENVTAKNFVTFAIHHSLNAGLVFVISASLIQSFISTSEVKKIFLNAKEISKLTQEEFDIIIDFKKIKKSASRRMLVLTSFFGIIHAVAFFLSSRSIADITPMLLEIIPISYLLITVYKFIFYVGMVNEQLKLVAKLLNGIYEYIPSKTVETYNVHLVNVKPAKKYKDPLRKLLAARKIFNLVYANGVLINESNGFTMLLVIMNLVVAIAAAGYEMFVIIVGGLPMDKIPGEFRKIDLQRKILNLFILKIKGTAYVIIVSQAILLSTVFYCSETQKNVCLLLFFFYFEN
jgi:hypothetical protein